MHFINDIGKSKVVSAEESLTALNSDTRVNACRERLTASNAMEIVQDFDVVVDCADNFSTKSLLKSCLRHGLEAVFLA